MEEKQLLITGFDPFGGEKINPAWEAVKLLPERIGCYRLRKLEIPTVFGAAAEKICAAAEGADVILMIGQAGGRAAVTPERVAINLRDARIADNAGFAPRELPCVPGGPDAYFATVPVRAMAEAICGAGLPGQVSLSAGAFVCNDTFYRVAHHFSGSQTGVGFIHVPFLPRQAKEGTPSMALEDIVRALTAAIGALDESNPSPSL